MQNYKEEYQKLLNSACEYLFESSKGEDCYQKTIYEAINYSLSAGGKRVRPVLVLAFCKGCGGDINKALPFAAAIEMIHTYSLIHDDLPCMDNDDLRRGKPTNHKVFGDGIAVLAGDALLNLAAETVLNKGEKAGLSAAQIIEGLSVLYKNSGIKGMIGGQVIDLEHENKETEEEVLHEMHSLKTGALIRAACVLGCIAADSGDTMKTAADEFGKDLGYAFQIADDILDVEGDVALLGKPIGSDETNQKTTFVSLYGLEKAKEKAKYLTQKAIENTKSFNNNDFLESLCIEMLERKK